MNILRIKITNEWEGWWFKKGMVLLARRAKKRITEDGQTDECHCKDCSDRRRHKKLFLTYEIIDGEYDGNLVPVVCAEEIE